MLTKTKQNILKNNLNYGLINARSISNKTETVVDFVLQHNLDVLCITETWLQSNDNFTTSNVTPCCFNIISNPRLNKHGGRVAVIIKNDFYSKRLASVCYGTFEVLLVQLTSFTKTFVIATIYRSPGALTNFLTDLSDLLSILVAKYDDFILAGDFNIHMDIETNESCKKLTELFNNFGLRQHVNLPTHTGGHILDLVISRDNTRLVQSVSVAEGITDHHSVLADLSIAVQKKNVIRKTFHQFKKLDKVKFQEDILSSDLYSNPSTDVDVLATQYHNIVSNLVSIHAPVITRTVTSHPPAPWYTPEIALARQVRRRLERRWKHTKLTVDREIFVAQKFLVNNILAKANAKYYICLVENNSSNPRQLWSTINSLSGNVKPRALPDHENLSSLVNSFNVFFTGKVTQIRANIGIVDNVDFISLDNSFSISDMSVFHEMKEADISNIIKRSPSKCCSLDPIPTNLLQTFETIVSPLIKLINLSLMPFHKFLSML